MKKRTKVLRWGIAAAALCIVCALAWIWANRSGASNDPSQVITLPETESMTVQIVRFDPYTDGTEPDIWEKSRIAAIVVDAGDNSVYPVGAELSLAMDLASPQTKIYLADGSLYEPDWDNLDLTQIGWEYGQCLSVEFQSYADGYSEDNHFYNLLYPTYLKAVEDANESQS